MKCSFCKTVMPRGTGKMYVRTDGTVYFWCSSKCEKNFGLGRNPKKVKWSESPKKK